MNTDQMLRELAENQTMLEFATTPSRAYILASQLQLALRHPANRGNSAEITQEFVDHLIQAIATTNPEAAETLTQGWDTTYDMSAEQFKEASTNEAAIQSIRIMNASNLLQEQAEAEGRVLVFASNAGLHMVDGMQDGNPNSLDLENIRGLTIAIRCNGFQGQLFMNAINAVIDVLNSPLPDPPSAPI